MSGHRTYFLLLLGLCLFFSACNAQQQGTRTAGKANRLAKESSPYLLQHANNPVDWFPWGDEAFSLAKKQQKLVIISVGYAACHWCHVMEHESFEDPGVAEIMNDRFISIKVDREERPDVDDIYLNACELASQRGCGWPLNAVALPDGRPIFVGTYFPKKQWLDVLERVSKIYSDQPERAAEYAERLTQGIQSLQGILKQDAEYAYSMEDLGYASQKLMEGLDLEKGGRKGVPKFPMASTYEFLLEDYGLRKDNTSLKTLTNTLDNIALGGIYDHLGGGFSRYATDERWKVPHFEKMLYDNGQLVSLYSKAYQLTKNPLYEKVVYESLEFVNRELSDPSGGFYSSLDADSEGEEGKFYVWQEEEIDALLKDKSTIFKDYFNIKKEELWEGEKYILFRQDIDDQTFAKRHKIDRAELASIIRSSKKILFDKRTTRVRPGLDDKVITAWNGLMLKGYIRAYRVLGDAYFLERALKNAEFLVSKQLKKGNRLNRIYKDGRSSINAFLDDYAQTAEAFIELYQATFDETWLYRAQDLADYAIAHFFDAQTGMFFYTSDEDDPLISRQRELTDKAIPGSNSTMCRVLFLLHTYLNREDMKEMANQMMSNMHELIRDQTSSFSNWAKTMTHMIESPYEVAIVGEDHERIRKEMDQYYLPNTLFLGGKDEGSLDLLKYKLVEGQTTIYVCREKVCKLPVRETEAAVALIKND